MKRNNKNETAYWQKYANVYDLTRKGELKAYNKIYSLIRNRIDSAMNVLELATGTGLIALSVANKAKHIDATDFSDAMIEKALQKDIPDNVSFSVEDACNLTFADDSYDIVIISNALHIMSSPEKALAEIRRVLKKGGIMIAPTYTPSGSLKEKIIMKFMTKVTGFPAYAKWTSDEYIKFLNQNGFTIKNKVMLKGSFVITYVECQSI